MRITRRLLAIPLLLAASAVPALGEVRDKAGLFSPEAIKKADNDLARIGRDTGVPVTIETIPSLEGKSIDDALIAVGKREGIKGLLVLIAAKDHKIQAGASKQYDRYFNRPRYESIYEAFMPSFRRDDFDGGLASGIAKIDTTLQAVKAEHAANPGVPAARQPVHNQGPAPVPVPGHPRASFNMMSLVWIVLLIVGVLFVFRLLGALFSAGRGGYGPGGYGPGGMRGPGYGGPGYGGGGGGGGGFMSSLFGGLGGAMAGNWLYDQFGRRHDQPGYIPPAEPGVAPTEAGNDWGTTAGDGGGDWGGGGDAGGGGGGDWGGGGGGGGDWGGGGGGGDGGSW